ncbi:MAG: hypothetical protein LUH43_05315 [Clostridia bacterium]|nr:hypothetical protein [Clostridia bacterium]
MQDYGGTITWVPYATLVFDIISIETTDSTDKSAVTDDDDDTIKSGCGSTVSALPMIIVSTAAVLVIQKKRKIKERRITL